MMEWASDLADRILQLMNDADPVTLAFLTWIFTALETTAFIGLVIPGEAIVLFAGSTVDSPVSFIVILSAATLGTFAGQIGAYGIGRAVGPPLKTSRLGRFVSAKRWDQAEDYLSGRGAWILIPIRFAAVLHVIVPIVAGIVHMSFRRFTFWSFLSAFVWASVYTVIGTATGSAFRANGYLGLLVSTGLIVAATVIAVVHARQGHRSDKEPAE